MPIGSGVLSGSGRAVGAVVLLNNNTVVNNGGDPIPFDGVFTDSSSFWDMANHRFTIPAGKAGLYHVGCYVELVDDPAITAAAFSLVQSGAAVNLNVPIVENAGLGVRIGVGSYLTPMAAGDHVYTDIAASGPATVTVVSGSETFLAFLGAT